MLEKLLSCSTLLSVGLMSNQEYNDLLDTLFMEMPKSDLLLDLEYVSWDIEKTMLTIRNYCTGHTIDYTIFGQFLMNALKKAYFNDYTNIDDFATKVYAAWRTLPSTIQPVEPFHIMCYAFDPLSWGDVEQAKELCEKMFYFYDKQSKSSE